MATLIRASEPTTMMTRVSKYKKKLNRFNKQNKKSGYASHFFEGKEKEKLPEIKNKLQYIC